MAFQSSIHLPNCRYCYSISKDIKKYTLLDTTFSKTGVGHFELSRLLEIKPNSGEGFLVKIIINADLSGFKLTVTDKSGLHLVNIFKDNVDPIIQEKFYFLMKSLVDRNIFNSRECNEK